MKSKKNSSYAIIHVYNRKKTVVRSTRIEPSIIQKNLSTYGKKSSQTSCTHFISFFCFLSFQDLCTLAQEVGNHECKYLTILRYAQDSSYESALVTKLMNNPQLPLCNILKAKHKKGSIIICWMCVYMCRYWILSESLKKLFRASKNIFHSSFEVYSKTIFLFRLLCLPAFHVPAQINISHISFHVFS